MFVMLGHLRKGLKRLLRQPNECQHIGSGKSAGEVIVCLMPCLLEFDKRIRHNNDTRVWSAWKQPTQGLGG